MRLGAAVDARLDAQREAVAERVDAVDHRPAARRSSARRAAPGRRSRSSRSSMERQLEGMRRDQVGHRRRRAMALARPARCASAFSRCRWRWMPSKASRSITGPTSVASADGSPAASSFAAPRIISITPSAMPSCTQQQAQRRAALAGRAEGALHHRIDHLLGQRAGVDHHRVDAAGLGDQRHDRAVLGGERAVDDLRHLRRAGEAPRRPCRAAATSAAPTVSPGPCSSCSASAGTPASCSSRTASSGDGRRLLGRLGQHGVAGRQRGRHLAREDREREVPRADADPGAAPRQAQLVALAGRAGQHRRPHDALGLVGVVAQEVDRLAHLGDRSRPRS